MSLSQFLQFFKPENEEPVPSQSVKQSHESFAVPSVQGATPERLGDEEPPCLFCAGSGFHGFSVCTWCDGIPKPVKEKTLSTELVIKRQTSTQFLMLESSAEHSEAATSTLVDQECKLCAADVANIVLRPCGHGGFCEDCARRLTGARSTAFCPYCRASIQAFLKIDPRREISVVHEEFQVNVSHWAR